MPVIEDNEFYKLVGYRNRDGTEVAQVFFKKPHVPTKQELEKIIEEVVELSCQ